MAPEPISTTYFINLSHQSVPTCIYFISLLGNGSVNTFPPQRRIVGGVAFYAVRVASKEIRLLALPRISRFALSCYMLYYSEINTTPMADRFAKSHRTYLKK
jgi:hypothetical protein